MENTTSSEFLDLSLAVMEYGIHARKIGLSEEQCSAAAFRPADMDPAGDCFDDLCRFGWAVEHAFSTDGLDACMGWLPT